MQQTELNTGAYHREYTFNIFQSIIGIVMRIDSKSLSAQFATSLNLAIP
jgi:hypothetical protein